MSPRLFLPLSLALGCVQGEPSDAKGDDTGPGVEVELGPRGDCNPVDPGQCLFPFPSSFFLAEDSATATGLRVNFGPGSLPGNVDGVPIDPAGWNRLDGFPILGRAVALLPGATTAGAATWADPSPSVDLGSKTLIIDAETGALVPHYAELERFTDDEARRALLLHPIEPMGYGRRYIVAMRDLVDASGAPVAAPSGFAALRDGATLDEPDLLRQQDHFEQNIFPVLEGLGLSRADLQLAWDFTTVSASSSLGPLVSMRERALDDLGGGAPAYTLRRVYEGDCADPGQIWRQVEGTMTVPLFLTTWDAGNDSRLVWGDDGLPAQNGDATVPFTVQVPCTLRDTPRTSPALQFGHGLFGDRSHAQSGAVAELVAQTGQVVIAVDWTGMKFDDVSPVTLALAQDATLFGALTDRLHQGQLEALLAGELVTQGLAADPAFIIDGVPLIDDEALQFYGVSQGGILGGAAVALSPRIQRATFSVPGAPFTMLLNRASPFQPFFTMLDAKYDDPADITALIASLQMLWDPGETGGWAPMMTGTPLHEALETAHPVPTERHVLLQLAKGDRSVTSLGGHVFARSAGAALVAPGVRSVWGLPEQQPPFVGSAVQEFDFGWEEPADGEEPVAGEVGPHDEPFHSHQGIAQLAHFLATGEVISVCDGPCDPD
jgi:hypothetical protein